MKTSTFITSLKDFLRAFFFSFAWSHWWLLWFCSVFWVLSLLNAPEACNKAGSYHCPFSIPAPSSPAHRLSRSEHVKQDTVHSWYPSNQTTPPLPWLPLPGDNLSKQHSQNYCCRFIKDLFNAKGKREDLSNKSGYWHILQGATSALQSELLTELILNTSVPGKKHKLISPCLI